MASALCSGTEDGARARDLIRDKSAGVQCRENPRECLAAQLLESPHPDDDRSLIVTTFVLIAGAGLGGWAWDRVVPLLRASGHEVHRVTLTGTGDRASENSPNVDLDTWITDVLAYLTTHDLQHVSLVGHSFSGHVISGVAERDPSRLARLIYLDALVPEPGQSALEQMGSEGAAYLSSLVVEHDGWSLPWFTEEQLDIVYQGHGFTNEDLDWVLPRTTAQPFATYQHAAIRAPLAAIDLPREYIRCTANPNPSPVQPYEAGWNWSEIDSGHWPMITAPEATATALENASVRDNDG